MSDMNYFVNPEYEQKECKMRVERILYKALVAAEECPRAKGISGKRGNSSDGEQNGVFQSSV